MMNIRSLFAPFRWIYRGFRFLCLAWGCLLIISLASMLFQNLDFWPDHRHLVIRQKDFREGAFCILGGGEPPFQNLTTALERAVEDSTVKKVLFDLDESSWTLSEAQQIRSYLKKLKKRGCEVICYASSFQAASSGFIPYYIASCANRIYLSSLGCIHFSGLSVQKLYWKTFLEDLGITPFFVQYKKYKLMPDIFTRSEMSKEETETWKRILGNIQDQLVKGIAEGRKKPLEDIEKKICHFSGDFEASQKAGLVTDSAPCFESVLRLEEDERPSITLDEYSKKAQFLKKIDRLKHRHAIALVRIEGNLMKEDQGSHVGATTYLKTLLDLSKDPKTRAIIVYIDSPGGTVEAAQIITYGLRQCRLNGKKVFAFLGSVAASGGYWVACGADKIWASPGSLTGSIGVFFGKFDIEKALKKWNIGVGHVSASESGSSESLYLPFTETQKDNVREQISKIYSAFEKLVAESRGIELSDMSKIAEGRIWTGEEALSLKLVDALGSMEEMILALRKTLKRPDKHTPVVDCTPSLQDWGMRLLSPILSRCLAYIRGVFGYTNASADVQDPHFSQTTDFSKF